MKKYMELPAGYTALSEDEMTYTSGGSAVGGVVTVVGVAVLASSYVWGISQAKIGSVFPATARATSSPCWAVRPTPSVRICPSPPPTSCVTRWPPVRSSLLPP